MLFSHATGFHAHCYVPVAELLADRFESFGVDHRGHGDSAAPPGWIVDWQKFGDDTVDVAERLAGDGGRLVGAGHSMGGAALLMAAAQRPDLFERLVLFEPIAIDTEEVESLRTADEMAALPIVQGARWRRRRFASFAEAIDNYGAKPPLSSLTAEALRCYVEHGLRPTEDGGVELKCDPELEAAVFIGSSANRVWELLADVDTPTVVAAGTLEADLPSRWAARVADRLPRGELVEYPHQTHFGPMSHPDEFAELIAGPT